MNESSPISHIPSGMERVTRDIIQMNISIVQFSEQQDYRTHDHNSVEDITASTLAVGNRGNLVRGVKKDKTEPRIGSLIRH